MAEIIEQYHQRKNKQQFRIRKITGIGMGSFILIIGLMLLLAKWLGIEFVINLDPLLRNLFGAVCLLYGGFRLWRSFQP